MDNLIEKFEASFECSWLPEKLLEEYSPVECLAENDQCTTLLLQSRSGEGKSVAKCYNRDNVQVSVAENEILSTVSHDGLPDYVGKYENDKTVCVVRRYIEGESFDKVIRGKKFTPEETASFALKVCDILYYLHSCPRPVLHRDIKPGNIVMDEKGNVYLIDFGISRMIRDAEKKDTKIAATASYAPPEQFGFLPTDARSDIYALGVVLNEMLTGSTELNKKGSGGGMDRIIAKCTAFSPDDRYRSAQQLKKDIRRWKRRHLRSAAAVLMCAVFIVLAILLAGFLKNLPFFAEKDVTEPVEEVVSQSDEESFIYPMEDLPQYSFDSDKGIMILSDIGDISSAVPWSSDNSFRAYKVTELVIGDGVSGVDNLIFGSFTNLRRLTLSASVYEEMEGNVFNGTQRLERITVGPDDITGVGWTYDRTAKTMELFYSGSGNGEFNGENSWHKLECINIEKIKHVKVGEGVTVLGFNMLWDHRSMESLELPGTLEKLDPSNFADTPSLVSVTVNPESKAFRSQDGVLYGLDDSTDSEYLHEKICFVPRDRTGVFSIPDGIRRLGRYCFADCKGITKIVFPESMAIVETSVFVNMIGLTGIELPENSNFMLDAEYGVLYTEGVSLQEDGTLITFMDILAALPYISGHYRIPDHYDRVEIYNDAFTGCKNLKEITIPENVVCIGAGSFIGCSSLEAINLPEDISGFSEDDRARYLGYEAFARSGLKSIRIPYGVTVIPEYCFYGCTYLTEVYIPDTVDSIESHAFEACGALRKIYRTNRNGTVIQSNNSGDTAH